MVNKKNTNLEQQVAQATVRIQELGMNVLNLRQMYEGVVQEKQALRNELLRAQFLLTALVVRSNMGKVTIFKATLDRLVDFLGVNIEESDGNVVLTAIRLDEIKEGQDD